jgi:hypothetical protein
MSKLLKLALLIYGIVTLIFGAALLFAPGRFLGLFGWAPVDPLLSRLLGAALLGMTWSALRAWRAAERERTMLLVESYAAFNLLGAVGIGRHLLGGAWYPFMVWFIFGLLGFFAVVWMVVAIKKPAN